MNDRELIIKKIKELEKRRFYLSVKRFKTSADFTLDTTTYYQIVGLRKKLKELSEN